MTEQISLFGVYLVHIHHFDEQLIDEALEIQRQQQIPFGKLALETGLMRMKGIVQVLAMQADRSAHGSRCYFGELAVEAGLITDKDRELLLGIQMDRRKKLGEILVDMGVINEQERTSLLEQYHLFLSQPS
ncbi:hypothetical protein FE236_09505 [Mariprofundus erugo]|uniref:Uncharacterized protein n=1 Tax=Mariprofundus erugo TaxID=2528639 RepID=A0A5R9GZN6_9PROT|nr:hypothetical protein [Mariprofundus erugo]TLS69247.1 hypothetical protein FEF65_01835 [Mariprofundus erugo]TLS75319.1 hypothetical protein FE236_09505 [Mariprofundus erugo]